MEYLKNSKEAVIQWLENLDDSTLVSKHNQMCQNQGSDDEIHNNDEEFFDTFFGNRIMEAVRAVSYGEYSCLQTWVKFNGYANLESFDNPANEVDLNEIANDVLQNPSDYDVELEDDDEDENDDE